MQELEAADRQRAGEGFHRTRTLPYMFLIGWHGLAKAIMRQRVAPLLLTGNTLTTRITGEMATYRIYALKNLPRPENHVVCRVLFSPLRWWDKLVYQTIDTFPVDAVTQVQSIFAEMRLL